MIRLDQLSPHPHTYIRWTPLGWCPEEAPPLAEAEPAPIELAPDTTVAGRYVVEGLIGQGGMGLVYRARQIALGGRRVAIKHINPAAFHPDDLSVALDTLKNEALVMASLSHPHLATVYDWVEDAGHFYLVMEYIEGQTLQQHIEQAGAPLSFQELVTYGSQICAVLNHLHSQDSPILYRDMKPSNLILDANGHLRLIDFGVARCFTDVAALERVEGTPGFASPEQLRVISSLPDVRSEVYSVGATLYYLATGQIPTDARRRIAEERLPPISRSRSDLPIRFHGLVKRAMKLNPDRRFQTVDDLHDALMQIQFETNNRETKRLPLYPILAEELQAVPATVSAPTADALPAPLPPRPTAIDRMKTLIGTAAQTLAQLTARHQAPTTDDAARLRARIQDWLGREEPLHLTAFRDGLLTIESSTKKALRFPLKVRFYPAGQKRPLERVFASASRIPGAQPPAWVVDARDLPYDIREALAQTFDMIGSGDDRRIRPRHRTRFQVTSPTFYGHKAVALDVNQEGVCVHAPYSLEPGLVTELSLEFDDETLEPLTVRAELRWCEAQSRGGAHLGFQFVEANDEVRRTIAQYEQHLTGPVAIRL
ncbi:MAG TPA: serine/threonine-protein kinase [Candidatus Xenobia bacterium]|jgi:tRNA A-37 threonylcarbamoyl transferase component Bud32